MSNLPDWLPDLIYFEDYDCDWQRYEDMVYSIFYSDFIASQPIFLGLPVYVAKSLIRGKEKTFRHCITEGSLEEERAPDLRRCERIRWIRSVLDNFQNTEVKTWQNKRGRNIRQLVWLEEAQYVVVLEKRRTSWFLLTAYCTDRSHTARKLRKEYETAQKKPTPP